MGLSLIRSVTLALFSSVAIVPASARADENAKGFACEFTSGIAGSYENGTFTSKPSAALKMTIENIDLGKQSATLHAEGSMGGKLAIARAIGANHFLEVANEGYWNITTIYDTDRKTGLNPAVHSRHLGVVGQPLFAQYTGTCRAAP